MNNQLTLLAAIELIKQVNPNEIESVQINHTKYDDGSRLFEVGFSYPATKEIVVSTDDGELIASVSLNHNETIVKDGYRVSGYDKD